MVTTKRKSVGRIFTYIGLSIFAFIQLFPLYWLFSMSLKPTREIIGDNPIGLPREWAFNNYSNAMSRGNIGQYLLNSLVVTLGTIIISTVLATMAAYAIGRMRWRHSGKTLVIFLSGMMIPIHATLVPLLVIMRNLHIYDTYWALILPYAAFALPMAVYVFVGFFKSLPHELEEAACIDGYTIYGVFFRIMLPLIRPAIATVTIFTYLSSWNELMFAMLFIGDENRKTLTAGLMAMVGRYTTNWGALGAGLAIATLPTLVIYVLMSGQIQKSFTTGAIKG